MGTVPGWSSGVTPTGGANHTPIYGSDIVDLRQWLSLYEFATNKQPPTGWTYNAGTVVATNTYYDGRNLPVTASVPHLLVLKVPGQFASDDWSAAPSPATTSTYDALRRPLKRFQPDANLFARWTYSGFSTTAFDENGHQKVTTTDALGRLYTVQEYTGAYPSTSLLNKTTYQFDVADRLTSIMDQANNTTTIVYDSLGRKTDLTDPDMGHWTYAYPASPSASSPLWLVQTQTPPYNPSGQNAITYQYDLLDRVTYKAAGNLYPVTYFYDVGTYGIGRRTSMQDGSGTATYTYDQRGRLTSMTRPIGTASYIISMTYDAMDRPLSITYPNGDVLSYVYGDHGLPIHLILNGAYLVQGATYNALLKLKTLPLGNGITTTYNYYGTGLDHQATAPDQNYSFGLLYQILTGPGAVLQNLTLAYDAVGNPKTMNPADHTSESLSFSYNEFDQLTQMTGSASESYGTTPYIQGTYDIGNLLAKGSTTLTYGNPAVPHAPSSASGIGGYGYDGNGNRVSDPTYAYTYDAENHLTLLKQGGANVIQNSFDGDGARLVRAVTGGATTHYIGDWYENDFNSNTPTAYYPFNGVPVAMKKGSTLSYLHHDQVGSLVSVSSASGAEVCSLRFGPFGNLRVGLCTNLANLPTDRLFTGQIGRDRI